MQTKNKIHFITLHSLFAFSLCAIILTAALTFSACNGNVDESDPNHDSSTQFIGTFKCVWREGEGLFIPDDTTTSIILEVLEDRTFTLTRTDTDTVGDTVREDIHEAKGKWAGSAKKDNYKIICITETNIRTTYSSTVYGYENGTFTLTGLDDGRFMLTAGRYIVAGFQVGYTAIFEKTP